METIPAFAAPRERGEGTGVHTSLAAVFKLIHLKGLSHVIDFDNVDENLQMLVIGRAAAGFGIFRRQL